MAEIIGNNNYQNQAENNFVSYCCSIIGQLGMHTGVILIPGQKMERKEIEIKHINKALENT